MSLFPFDVQRPLIDLSCLPNLERLERKSDSSRIRASVEGVLDENDDPTAVYCARLTEFRVQTPITPLSTTCAFSPRMGPRIPQVSNAIFASPSLSSRGETPVLSDFLDEEQVSLQVVLDAGGIGQKPQVARRLERIRAREENPFAQDSNLSPVRKVRKIAEKQLAALQTTYDTDESRETDGSESEYEGDDIQSEYEDEFNGSRLNQRRLTVGGQLTRFKWTEPMKECFNQAFNDLQESQRTSKNILEKMGEINPKLCVGLSAEQIKSHLQKYRIKNNLTPVKEKNTTSTLKEQSSTSKVKEKSTTSTLKEQSSTSKVKEKRLTSVVGENVTKFQWTEPMKECFKQVFNNLQESQRTSKNILEKMGGINPELCVGLNTEQIKSYLQKYRIDNNLNPTRKKRSASVVGKNVTKLRWTEPMKECFKQAFNDLPEKQRVPCQILEKMQKINPELCVGLNTEHIKSHLQVFRAKNHFASVRIMRLRIHKGIV